MSKKDCQEYNSHKIAAASDRSEEVVTVSGLTNHSTLMSSYLCQHFKVLSVLLKKKKKKLFCSCCVYFYIMTEKQFFNEFLTYISRNDLCFLTEPLNLRTQPRLAHYFPFHLHHHSVNFNTLKIVHTLLMHNTSMVGCA